MMNPSSPKNFSFPIVSVIPDVLIDGLYVYVVLFRWMLAAKAK